MAARFYLETVERVFQRHLLPRGELIHRGRRVDPAAIERTVAVMLGLPGGQGRIDGSGHAATIPALSGPAEHIAGELRAYAAEGIAHVQLVLDPITIESVQALAPVLTELDRG
jgi:poly(3-hydroxybutyrate) depolymerase